MPHRSCFYTESLPGAISIARWFLSWWLLDIGTGAVLVAEDDRGNDPVPANASRNCQMGWCDLCDGTRHASDTPTAPPCTHHCHTAIEATAGGQPETEAGDEH